MADPLLIARHDGIECSLLPGLANRHGLITGATGTGKTVTLQTIAEKLSAIGVPVFMADVKGDLTGASQPGSIGEKMAGILKERGLEQPPPLACPVTLWDVFGEQGHPVRATISDMGPLLLGRMLNLNETQAGVLNLVFKIADDNGLLLLDLKDLRAMLQHVGENASQFTTEYGNISAASVGAIQRGLLQIESQGGDKFFGEPMLNISDFMQTEGGKGVVNILAADKLMNSPRLYATFLLWLLSELFEQLPEIGDPEQPKLVFFFDEAHLLFNEAPKALVERIELVVRLVRSKGVGVFFVTQNPLDIPDTVLAQLGNRVQHALRAFTPRDQKAVKATATTMRQKPGLDIETAITELAVGEALVSFLDAKGRPSITERVYVLPPGSQIGPITPAQRQALIANSLVAGVYEKAVDRESAYEKLKGRAETAPDAPASAGKPGGAAPAESGGVMGSLNEILFGSTGARRQARWAGADHGEVGDADDGDASGKEILRGVLGGSLGPSRGGECALEYRNLYDCLKKS
ncbi:helicase HerA-like domain-containing protein [Variovorax sp. WS11]|uniref:helicase HerA-like domain-containing protein n=1 Tax=Variovorax sp. WS11 TaxID=1105204 RepID=UPI001EF2FCDF|nr:helicase HerA-like domain-containing protein [Variovorax sp. WS11]